MKCSCKFLRCLSKVNERSYDPLTYKNHRQIILYSCRAYNILLIIMRIIYNYIILFVYDKNSKKTSKWYITVPINSKNNHRNSRNIEFFMHGTVKSIIAVMMSFMLWSYVKRHYNTSNIWEWSHIIEKLHWVIFINILLWITN